MHIYNPQNIYQHNKITKDETSQLYTLLGIEDYIEDTLPMKKNEDDTVYAKKISRLDGSVKYLVKLDRTSKLYNPISTLDNIENNKNLFINDVCRQGNKFKEVNQKTFDWYVRFLSTKNISWLHNAEREMM